MNAIGRARAAALIAAALSLAAAPPPLPPVSPACGLLTAEEAAAALGAAATVEDGGPEASGVSGCAWANQGKMASLSVQIIGPVMFTSSATEADVYYESVIAGVKASGRDGKDVEAGDKAYLVLGGIAEMPAFTLIMLKGGKLVTVTTVSVGEEQALAAARTIAGRL